jgi:exodeoxyribonuclease VII large subunit
MVLILWILPIAAVRAPAWVASRTLSCMTIVDAPPTVDAPWSISLFSGKLKGWIERLGTVWVEGEITQWGISGGNVYGKLKDLDGDATISFTIWSSVLARLPDDLKQGDRVIALVKPTYWLKGGTLSMQVADMRHVGLGDLLERLERLRTQLRSEGLFEHKRALPFLPRCIGLVTGKDSDAEKDVLRNAQLRWPAVNFRVVHAAVQGDRAVGEVIRAIRVLDDDSEVDVIIIARGGGDFQNLLVFSDEGLVRAAAASGTPIVSAIGHEADRPILDDVADLRASTPTDAAKRVVPDVADELARVQQARSGMRLRITQRIAVEVDRLEALRSRPVLAFPETLIETRADDVGRYLSRSRELIDLCLERAHTSTVELTSQVRALSPQRTLARGYAIAQLADGRVLTRAADAPPGASLVLTVADGKVATTVDDGRARQSNAADSSMTAG